MQHIDLQDVKNQKVIFQNNAIKIFLGPIKVFGSIFAPVTNGAVAEIEINYNKLLNNFILLPIHYNLAIDEELGIMLIDNCIALNLKEFEKKFA